jgi:hypothetical protein
VIPILPSECVTPPAANNSIVNLKRVAADISKYLKRFPVAASDGSDTFELFENVVDTALLRLKGCLNADRLAHYKMTDQSYTMLFLASVARCNLEMELMLRGGTLVKPNQHDVCLVTKKSCIRTCIHNLSPFLV